MNKTLLIICVIFLAVAAELQAQVGGTTLTSQELAQIEEILQDMTVEEKVGQMTQVTLSVLTKKSKDRSVQFDPEKVNKAFSIHHVGSILNTTNRALSVEEWHTVIDKVQKESLSSGAKVPCLYGIDAIHGTTYTEGATLFPHNLGLAASRNLDLARSAAHATALETRASGIRWNFDPVLDIGRQPLWSRFPETFGESTELVSQFGTAIIETYEQKGLKDKEAVASCMKHFLGYSAPANGKDRTPAYIPEIEIYEHYLPQFKRAIDAGASTIMINSASLNGVPIHGSHYWLTEVLQEKLGFDGVIVTDWEDIKRLHTRHKVAKTPEEAVKLGVLAGLDMSMVPFDFSFHTHLVNLVNKGEITEERIDESVRKILKLKMKLGLFDNPYPEKKVEKQFGREAFEKIALDAAHESIVLLENKNSVLPLTKAPSRPYLVVGPTANSNGALNGSWSFSWQGNIEKNYPEDYLPFTESLEKSFGPETIVSKAAPGFKAFENYDLPLLQAQIDEVKPSAIILCLGEDAYAESPGAISDLNLPQEQQALAKVAADAGVPLILVLLEGRPRVVSSIVDLADAVVLANLPGKMGGQALKDVLFGDYNPSGVLPYSYPRHSGDVVTYDEKFLAHVQQLTPGKITYGGYNPQWPFGHGLSYTAFEFGEIELSNAKPTMGEVVEVGVKVTNTGSEMGGVCVDLFLSDLYASISPDFKKLIDFRKVQLAPGETTELKFRIDTEDMSFITTDLRRVVEPGKFKLRIKDQEVEFELVADKEQVELPY